MLVREPDQTIVKRQTPKYDLGLGKNKPLGVASNKESLAATSHNNNHVHQAVEYLVEHDGTMAYPSPEMVQKHRERLLQSSAASSSQQSRLGKSNAVSSQRFQNPYTQQQHRIDIPVMVKSSTNDNDGSHFVVNRAATNDLDMNTAWVQLLMLEQQKLALQAS
jgi:hypothetical protein